MAIGLKYILRSFNTVNCKINEEQRKELMDLATNPRLKAESPEDAFASVLTVVAVGELRKSPDEALLTSEEVFNVASNLLRNPAMYSACVSQAHRELGITTQRGHAS